MKKIKIKFVDVGWYGDNAFDYIIELLRKHFEVELSDDPDYIFFAWCGREHLKYSDCIKIFISGENLVPDFNLCDYAISSDIMNFGDRQQYFPDWAQHVASQGWAELLDRDIDNEKRSKFCSFIYSNARADEYREKLLNAIDNYQRVDCGGRVNHNIDIPHVNGNNRFEDRIDFEKQYKFSIACENSSSAGYTTEKIIISFMAGTVPIYWGDPQVKNVFNEKAFICAMDYNTPEEVAEAVKRINEDPELYEQMRSAEIFADDGCFERKVQELEDFLYNIFSQPKNKAYRRNRTKVADWLWTGFYYGYPSKRKKLISLFTHPVKTISSYVKGQIG